MSQFNMLTYEQRKALKKETAEDLGCPISEIYVGESGKIYHISPFSESTFEPTRSNAISLDDNL